MAARSHCHAQWRLLDPTCSLNDGRRSSVSHATTEQQYSNTHLHIPQGRRDQATQNIFAESPTFPNMVCKAPTEASQPLHLRNHCTAFVQRFSNFTSWKSPLPVLQHHQRPKPAPLWSSTPVQKPSHPLHLPPVNFLRRHPSDPFSARSSISSLNMCLAQSQVLLSVIVTFPHPTTHFHEEKPKRLQKTKASGACWGE